MLELHPDTARLRSFGLGRLSAIDAATIEDHVLQCERCCEKLRNVSGDRLLDLAKEAAQSSGSFDAIDTHVPPELIDHPRYRILDYLGHGGMGTVFKAHHRFMDRTVALKVIQRKFVNKPDAVERFRNEVRMAAKLHHPNIVAAHDAEEFDGLHFLVMEYVEGISLDRFAAKQKGPIPYPLACHIIRQAAVGLQHAHKHGLVHRDIKPQNIMLTRRGHVKVLDFGLTRLSDDPGYDPKMTRENLVVGTPDFIAPEQARNSRDVDTRTDLYALGCTFYFLLTRRVPFPGMTPFEKMIAHTEIEPAPVIDYRKDFPPELDAILKKMTAKRREDRYATPSEVVSALAPFARLSLSASNSSVVVPPAGTESDAEMTNEKTDTSEMNEPPTRRVSPQSRSRTPRPSRKRRRTKNLPYRAWIAGTIVGTALLFLLIFLAALRGKPESDPSKGSTDGPALAKVEEKGSTPTGLLPAEKDPSTPKDGEFSKKTTFEPPSFRDGIPSGGKGFPDRSPSRGRNDRWDGKGSARGKNDRGEGLAPLKGKNVLLLVPNRNAAFSDIDPIRDALEPRGALVLVVSTDKRVCTGYRSGKKGFDRPYDPRIDLSDDLNPDRFKTYDAVICGGGDVSDFLNARHRDNLKKLFEVMSGEKRLFGAINTGQALLARTGHLDNKEAARLTNPLLARQFELTKQEFPGVKWLDRKVVQDGNLITAAGGSDTAEDFADEIVKALLEQK